MFELKIENTPVSIYGVSYSCEPYNGNDSRTRLANFEVPEFINSDNRKVSLIGLQNDIRDLIPELDELNELKTYLVYRLNDDYPKKELAFVFSLRCSTLVFSDENKNDKVLPSVELVYFSSEKKFRINHPECKGIGRDIFDQMIFERAKAVSKFVGCSNLIVFAINESKLINYYKNELLFEENQIIETQINKSLRHSDNRNTKFLYQALY